MRPSEIAALLIREGSGRNPEEYDEDAEPPGAREHRTQILVNVLSSCQEAWASGSEELDLMAEKLGDGSRDG